MHLGATVHQWLLIVRILLKPKSGRKDEACRADGRGKLLEIHSKRIRIKCGGSQSRFSVVFL